jgi:hypothetical protein
VTCEYCGETLTGGKHEWALDNVQQLEKMSEEEEMGEED